MLFVPAGLTAAGSATGVPVTAFRCTMSNAAAAPGSPTVTAKISACAAGAATMSATPAVTAITSFLISPSLQHGDHGVNFTATLRSHAGAPFLQARLGSELR